MPSDDPRQEPKLADGAIEVVPKSTLNDITGCTGYEGPARSLVEMEEAIHREARRQSLDAESG